MTFEISGGSGGEWVVLTDTESSTDHQYRTYLPADVFEELEKDPRRGLGGTDGYSIPLPESAVSPHHDLGSLWYSEVEYIDESEVPNDG